MLKSWWLISLYRHLLEKDQEGLSVSARGSLWLGSPSGVTASGFSRVWPCCNSKQEHYDLILPEKSEIFYPGTVKCLRPGIRLLGRSPWESRQCKGKSVATIIFKYLQDRFKVIPRKQPCQEKEEGLRKE